MVKHCWGKGRAAWTTALAGALVALLAWAAPAAYAAPAAHDQLARLGPAPAHQRLSLVLPLRADLAGLERFAAAVTTVGSPLYGQYESIPVLARRFGASSADRARVTSFLRRSGARSVRIDRTGLFADATMPVAGAQRTFGTALSRYESGRVTRFVAPTGSARVPAALAGAVTGVVGLDTRPLFGGHRTPVATTRNFAHVPAKFGRDNTFSGYQQRSGTGVGCAAALAQRGFTPNQYLTAYDYAPLQSAGLTGQGERVALIEIDGYHYSDLTAFASCFGLPIPAVSGFGVNLRHPLTPGGESTLDLEILDAAAPGLKAVDVYESRARASDVLRSLTAPLQNGSRVPQVISASLGTCEPALQISIGASGIRAAEGALALAAASGISVLSSSGDAGSTSCIGRSGPIDALAVSYPASSPWVTAVGGTNVELNAANQISAQIVWNDAPANLSAGGGGISRLFRRPGYQQGDVPQNRRGVPDVSMLADVLPGYDIYCTAADCARASGGNPWIAVGGTSAASPLLAGGFALVDQTLRAHQKQSLGVANSLLYRIASTNPAAGVFSDVTGSDNDLGPYLPGGNHRALGCCSGTPGYDLATGLGSVDLAKLALVATADQPAIAKVGLLLPGQRSVARHHLVARLTCSRRCIVRAAAQISIPQGRGIAVNSNRQLLRKKGARTVKLDFSPRQLSRLRTALRQHRHVFARVSAELLDSGGNVEAISVVRTLRIRH
ncbi:MAG: S53 family peptidase [Solirubrobacteraceae bacterium]